MTLELDATTHTYRLDGNVIAGVTDTIKPLAPDFDRFPAIEARRRGVIVHALTAVMDGRADLWPEGIDEGEEDGALQGYCDAWQKFKGATHAMIEPDDIERQVHHRLYGYAGTVDRVVTTPSADPRLSSPRWVVDIKTGAYHPTHILQLAAYDAALGYGAPATFHLSGGIAVYLRLNGSYTTRSFTIDELRSAFTVFIALRTLAGWRKEHESFKPEPVDDWAPLADDEVFQL